LSQNVSRKCYKKYAIEKEKKQNTKTKGEGEKN
jgi:hypothetical protein